MLQAGRKRRGFLIIIFSGRVILTKFCIVLNDIVSLEQCDYYTIQEEMGVSQSTSTSILLLSTSDLIRRNLFVIALTVLGIV